MKGIILTGATGGLGFALGNLLVADRDSDLICVYRDKIKFEKLYKEKNQSVKQYLLNEKDDFSRLVQLLSMKNYDCIVVLLNAFSITPIKRIGDFDTEEVEQFIYGNLIRNILLINKVVAYCKHNSIQLRVINLDSGAADFPLSGWSNYCSSKAYINSFLSVLFEEEKSFQIVSFDPGVMDTTMQEEIRNTDHRVFNKVEMFIEYKENNKLRQPNDVALQIIERYVNNWTATELREKVI